MAGSGRYITTPTPSCSANYCTHCERLSTPSHCRVFCWSFSVGSQLSSKNAAVANSGRYDHYNIAACTAYYVTSSHKSACSIAPCPACLLLPIQLSQVFQAGYNRNHHAHAVAATRFRYSRSTLGCRRMLDRLLPCSICIVSYVPADFVSILSSDSRGCKSTVTWHACFNVTLALAFHYMPQELPKT